MPRGYPEPADVGSIDLPNNITTKDSMKHDRSSIWTLIYELQLLLHTTVANYELKLCPWKEQHLKLAYNQ
jgi:hypothetical protein